MEQVDVCINDCNKNIIYPVYLEDEICDGVISKLEVDLNSIVDKQYNKITEVYTLNKLSFKKFIFIGLGSKDDCTSMKIRKAFVTVSKTIDEPAMFIVDKAINNYNNAHQITQIFVESYLYGSYTEHKINHELKNIVEVSLKSKEDIRNDILVGKANGEGVNYARVLADTPANHMTPVDMVNEAISISKQYPKLEVSIIDKEQLQKMEAGGILSVNLGSDIPAYMIVFKYHNSDKPFNAIVGKGLTFDSGGYNIKGNSFGMKYDMCGGANVFGIMKTLAMLDVKTNVYGVVPTTENLINGQAYKPQDVITTLSKKTVEIVSTDAEGRLILCDALTYVQTLNVEKIFDLATLTGACVSALGEEYTGVFANNEEFYNDFDRSLKACDEKGWRLPMDDAYFDKLKSNSADFKNSVGKPGAGASVAANFLNAFIEKGIKWIHLDIAGTADNDGTGATGCMIRSIVHYLENN